MALLKNKEELQDDLLELENHIDKVTVSSLSHQTTEHGKADNMKSKLNQLRKQLTSEHENSHNCNEQVFQQRVDDIIEIDPLILAQIFRKYKVSDTDIDFFKSIKLIKLLIKSGYIYKSSNQGLTLPSNPMFNLKTAPNERMINATVDKREIEQLYGTQDYSKSRLDSISQMTYSSIKTGMT